MSVRPDILKKLTSSRNQAVERAVEVALTHCTLEEQAQLADVLLERNHRQGWVALIRMFNRLDESVRQKLVARPRDLFGPLAESLQDTDGPARENVITIVQHCADARLVYLLAESLMDARPEVRELAGQSLLQAVRRHCERGKTWETPADVAQDAEDESQVARAVDFALRRFRTHRQTAALLAALIHVRQLTSTMWTLFEDPYEDLTRAATMALRAPPEPALATALLLALGSALKPAAMAGLAGIENAALAGAVVEQSFRLLDPVLRDAAQSISHLKMLPALRKDKTWSSRNWMAWLRLIESVGLQPVERLSWLSKMLEAIPTGSESAAWKMSALRAVGETALVEAGPVLAAAVRDDDERVARCAARVLLSRRIVEWRELAVTSIQKSPHLSVRRMPVTARHTEAQAASPATARGAGSGAAMAGGSGGTVSRGFERAWNEYQKMPPVVQHNTARTMANEPASAEQLRKKLQSDASPQDIAQALKMLWAVKDISAYRNQVIALCGHGDPRIAAMAVRLVGRLEDPRLRDLLEAAMQHSDPRVRANAVESVEQLHIADRSQQVLAMLNSRHNRERANAIKAIGQFNFGTARECLGRMLTDPNPLHRLSALWVVGQLDLLEVMRQVSIVARRDPNLRVRNKAVEMLETLSGSLQSH